jgi:hypothetical protein
MFIFTTSAKLSQHAREFFRVGYIRLVSLDASRSSSTLRNSHQHDRHQNLMRITKPVIGNKSRRHIQIGQNQSIGMGLAILLDGFERRKCVPANDRSGAWRRWPASGDAS